MLMFIKEYVDKVNNIVQNIQNIVCPPPKKGDIVFLSRNQNSLKEKQLLGELINEGGGEGAIYKIGEKTIAKIYKKSYIGNSQQVQRNDKIVRLIGIHIKEVCLPNGILYNEKGYIVGYTMPYEQGNSLDSFIKQNRKNENWEKEAVTLSLNILRVIKELHKNGIILGDINGSNILVEDTSHIHFIDTDSYQVKNIPCPVGKVEFTAPEIQGKEFSTFLRTYSHENYAIATLLFMIFMRGRKPYDRINGGTDGENIVNGVFPYSVKSTEEDEMIPLGPWMNYWNGLNYHLRMAFFNSFKRGQENFLPANRLDCLDWIKILQIVDDNYSNKKKKINMSEKGYIDEDFVSNAATRVPICICLDLSGSMLAIENSEYNSDNSSVGMAEGKKVRFVEINDKTITRIGELRKGLDAFFKAIRSNEYAHDGAEIAVVGFNYDPVVLLNFDNIDKQTIPNLVVKEESPTYIGKAVEMGLDLLEKRKNYYKKMGAPYSQPFLVVMSDGDDNDNPAIMERACTKTRKLVSDKKLTVIPVGIGKDANLVRLGNLTSTGAYRLKNLDFEKFFVWLSASVSGRVSQQSSDIYIAPNDKDWGEIE